MVIGPRFTIKSIEPPDVRTAPTAQRRAFWQAVAAYVIEAKDRELRAGLDRFGRAMTGLSQYTIEHRHSDMGPADPHAPPLQPAHGLSRTRSLFTAQPTSALDGVTCWWSYDSITGASWGEILRYHRDGSGKLPIRDVIGLSPKFLAWVKQKADAWWAGQPREVQQQLPIPPPPRIPPPTFKPPVFTPRTSGWGRVTALPGKGPRSTAEILRSPTATPGGRQWKTGTHVYTLMSGIGLR